MADEGESAIQAAYDAMREAWDRHGEIDLQGRAQVLGALRKLLIDNAHGFAAALNSDFGGRSLHESLLTEVALVVSAIDHARPRLTRWARPRRLRIGWPHWPASARIVKRARGLAGIIGPSNYPLQLVLMPLISALSAGCRVLIKPSESAPRTSKLLHQLVLDSIDPAVVSVVPGGPSGAARLSTLPLDILLFTGSTHIGRRVAKAASANLTPTILELGGKSSVIVDRGADLARTSAAIVWGKLLNAGQTCVAPDYVLVPAENLQSLVDHMIADAHRYYPDSTARDYTAIRSAAQYDRLAQLEFGHTLVPLFDGRLERPFYHPKLIIDPPLSSQVMQEEIFGPLLPLLPYDGLGDAISIINKLPPALVLYWFGARNKRCNHTLRNTASAAVSINETVVHAGIPEIPLGGLRSSGMGRYHGRAGFDAFTYERPVFHQSRVSITQLLKPPFGRYADAILRRLLR